MNEREVISAIRECSELLASLSILESFINPSFLQPNDGFNRVSFKRDSKYEEIFLTGLQSQYFNIILKDYSYFQFNFRKEEDRTSGCLNPFARYAFYPNPFESFDQDFLEIYELYQQGELEFEDYSQALSEAKPLSKKIPVRYDLSFKQYKRIYHPVAHFHFGLAEDSRLVTDKLFSPLLFVMFIVNMYYIDYWKSYNKEKGEYSLDQKYERLVRASGLVRDFNSTEAEFFCSLQENLICIR